MSYRIFKKLFFSVFAVAASARVWEWESGYKGGERNWVKTLSESSINWLSEGIFLFLNSHSYYKRGNPIAIQKQHNQVKEMNKLAKVLWNSGYVTVRYFALHYSVYPRQDIKNSMELTRHSHRHSIISKWAWKNIHWYANPTQNVAEKWVNKLFNVRRINKLHCNTKGKESGALSPRRLIELYGSLFTLSHTRPGRLPLITYLTHSVDLQMGYG